MTTRKMKINAAKKAKRDRDNGEGGGSSRSRIHHSSCRCPHCGGTPVTATLVDTRTDEPVLGVDFCLPPDKKELH